VKRSEIALLTHGFPGRATYDTAVSHALLRRVASGARSESLRLYRPEEIVLFSILDARRPGFPRAVEAAHDLGCQAVMRLAGGHAALFHADTLAFSWSIPAAQSQAGIGRRFETLSDLVVRALKTLGVDARIGEVEGEYCPGRHSVNAGGRSKLMGVGQRVIKGGAHVGGMIVVGDSARVKTVLAPVYEALELEWCPATAGSVEDECPGASVADVTAALVREIAIDNDLVTEELDAETLALAEEIEPWHRPLDGPNGPRPTTLHALPTSNAATPSATPTTPDKTIRLNESS
jgi:octanoyl-[GcvH]:protein N-octanoyltransferase